MGKNGNFKESLTGAKLDHKWCRDTKFQVKRPNGVARTGGTDKQTDRQPTKTGEYPSPQGPGQQVKISGMGDSINLGF